MLAHKDALLLPRPLAGSPQRCILAMMNNGPFGRIQGF